MYPATMASRGRMCGAQRKAERRSENGEEKGERAVVEGGEGEREREKVGRAGQRERS